MPKSAECSVEINEQETCSASNPDETQPDSTNSIKLADPSDPVDHTDSIDPTQQDYIDFIGPNSQTYLRNFAKFKRNQIETYVFTWHWPVFFVGCWWFLYRKQYVWFIAALATVLFVPLFLIGWLTMPIFANYLYYKDATKKIRQLKKNKADYTTSDLAEIGRTNNWVPWVAVVVNSIVALIGIAIGFLVYNLVIRLIDWINTNPSILEFLK